MATFEQARLDLVDLQAHRYRAGSGLESRYHRSRGLLVIPVQGPADTPPVVVRVHAPIGFREVEFQYAKQGGPPLIPAAADTTSGDTILDERLTFPAPGTDPGGALVFGVRGHYVYVQPGTGRGAGDEFPIDSHPFLTGIDALGEFDVSVLHTPGQNAFLDDVVNGRWNRDVIDSGQLMAYNIIG